jgi:hypothetical protein
MRHVREVNAIKTENGYQRAVNELISNDTNHVQKLLFEIEHDGLNRAYDPKFATIAAMYGSYRQIIVGNATRGVSLVVNVTVSGTSTYYNVLRNHELFSAHIVLEEAVATYNNLRV